MYNLNIYNTLNAKLRVCGTYIIGPQLIVNTLNFRIELEVIEGKLLHYHLNQGSVHACVYMQVYT